MPTDHPGAALVLDGSGFPRSGKLFPGNVSESNIGWLKEQGYRYLVASRKRSPPKRCQGKESMLNKSSQKRGRQRFIITLKPTSRKNMMRWILLHNLAQFKKYTPDLAVV